MIFPRRYLLITLVLSSVLPGLPIFACAAHDAPMTVPMTDHKVRIDGTLDDSAWDSALVIPLNVEVNPGENIEPPVKTDVLVTYASDCVYFAFRAFDPKPAQIIATLADRDSIWADDWVMVVLDTFNDERRSLNFGVSASGVQTEFIEYEEGSDTSWDAIWNSAARIHDWGYAVEMEIPYTALRFQRTEGEQTWGFDAVRFYPRLHRHQMGLFPRDRNNNCYLCQAMKIKGFAGASPGKNLEIAPTLTAVRTDTKPDMPHGRFVAQKEDLDAGLTARWGLTPNLTLHGTINPDFSQVEADARQLDINQPFALFFPEKRPFFTEGSDFYIMRFTAVYTRTLRDPSWGIKLSGKEGANTIGAFLVRDDVTNLIFPGSQSSLSTSMPIDSMATVVRYKRDIGNKYTLGALITDREGEDYFNRLAGFDGYFRFSKKDSARLTVMGSSTRYPLDIAKEFNQKEDAFSDLSYELRFDHNTRNLYLYAGYRSMGEDFRADLGFVPQVDYKTFYTGGIYNWIGGPDRWFTRISLKNAYQQFHDQAGGLIDRNNYVELTYEGPWDAHSYFQPKVSREAYNGELFDLTSWTVHHCMNPIGGMHVWANVDWGDRIDYANTRLGDRVRVTPGIMYSFLTHWSIDFSYLLEKMHVNDEPLYTAQISQGTFYYHINTKLFVRSIIQYVSYDYNPNNYTFEIEPEQTQLFTQFLFSYKLNPQTVLFFGYSDDAYGTQDFDLTRQDRTFFIKLGYAWQL
ncbi:DUF5916 domain-containing protein [Acidobacteriota bacterium]